MAARYRLHLLGECQLLDQHANRPVEFHTRKAKCLLGLVALWSDATMSREKLASYLWDPAPDEQARASLRQCLKEVRDLLGQDAAEIVTAERSSVRINLQHLEVDALELGRLVQAPRTDAALAMKAAQIWKGELFGDTLPSAPLFEAWVQVERSRLKAGLSALLTDHLQAQLRAQDFASQDIAHEVLKIEPCHELAHQFMMRYFAKRGDQAAALRQYTLLEQALADEIDSEPSIESSDLLVAIKKGEIRQAADTLIVANDMAPDVRSRRDGPPRIVIRPPLTRFRDDSKDYLSEGFTHLAKASLSRFRCWIILPWPSTDFSSKVKIDFQELGRTIGADYVIDPVLDWRGQQGKLFISLIDCKDSSEVWSDIYDVGEDELQSLSSTVAGAIASKLASRINHITLLRYARSAPGNAAAYDMWLRGHQLSRDWKPESDRQAQDLFLRAIELDPGLACAYSSLASVLSTQGMVRPGYASDESDRRKAFDLAQKAISLDPFDSRNHITMGWNWLLAASAQRAESHFKIAVDLNPFDSETLIASAMGMAFMGHSRIAQQWSESALALNPLHPEYFLGYLAAIKYLSGDHAGALNCIALSPDIFPEQRAWAAAAHARLGEETHAAKAYGEFFEAVSANWEGERPVTPAAVQRWLFSSLPLVWNEGRKNFEADLLGSHAHFIAANQKS
jgi:DNA-binding SARP family transcriptional activator